MTSLLSLLTFRTVTYPRFTIKAYIVMVDIRPIDNDIPPPDHDNANTDAHYFTIHAPVTTLFSTIGSEIPLCDQSQLPPLLSKPISEKPSITCAHAARNPMSTALCFE